MLGFNRGHLSIVLSAILGGAAIVWLALEVLIPAPPKKITIATGQRNQIYQAIGNSYRTILARSGVDVDVRLTNGAVENLALVNDPHSGVTAGIVQGGISDGTQSPDVLSLGRINYQIYWLFYSAAETITDLRQLKGKRIALGPEGSGQRPLTEKILEISGVSPMKTRYWWVSRRKSPSTPSMTARSMRCFCPLLWIRQFSAPCWQAPVSVP
jgi:TRAP-type uncharacterized transport system substrate-binding protein